MARRAAIGACFWMALAVGTASSQGLPPGAAASNGHMAPPIAPDDDAASLPIESPADDAEGAPILIVPAPPTPIPTPVLATPSAAAAADLDNDDDDPAPKAKDSDDVLFPRYKILKHNVAFWTKVFSEYSENQSVIHFMGYPDKVVEVLDFRDDAATMTEGELYNYRRTEEGRAKARAEAALAECNAGRNSPDSLGPDARRMFKLFADVEGDDRFKDAIGTIRAQRGLRERTQAALETSGKYLPSMEGVFRGYGLPVRLTRLPLVESSFNVEAYSKVGAAGLWQFMPSSARIYMRLNDVVDDRRDPWTSTDAAARHLRDDYAMLGSWPLAVTAYNHGRGGIAHGLQKTGGTTLPDLIRGYDAKSFGFASRNFYSEFLAAYDVEHNWKKHFGDLQRNAPLKFEVVETRHYVPYETLRRLCNADDDLFRRLNPAYRPEVIEGKLYVPPGHLIRVPAGSASTFEVAYSRLGSGERFDRQRVLFLLYKVKKGESLSRVAKRYGVSQDSIRNANGFTVKTRLRTGQIIKVPPREESRPGPITVAVGESKAGLTREETQEAVAERAASAPPRRAKAIKPTFRTHQVKSGQTLSSIAQVYKVSINDLRKVNGLGASSHITVGQKLRVPTG